MNRNDLFNIARGALVSIPISASLLSSSYLTNPYLFVVKANQISNDKKIFQKLNKLAGGDDSQMTADGTGLHINLLVNDTVGLMQEPLFYEIFNTASRMVEVKGVFGLSLNTSFPYDENVIPSPYQPMLNGTSIERIAFGLTLSATDRLAYFDNTMDSVFWWNGTQFIQFKNNTNIVSPLTNYNVLLTDHFIDCTGGSNGITITLPNAVGDPGLTFIITKVDSGIGRVTIATTSGQTINGSATYMIIYQYISITLHSNGSNWIIN